MQELTLKEPSVAKASKRIEERIIKKSLDLIVLRALEHESMSGYAIILFVDRRFGVRLSAGTVYSLLYSLERNGFIRAHVGKAAKSYILRKKGEVTLLALKKMQNRLRALNGDIF